MRIVKRVSIAIVAVLAVMIAFVAYSALSTEATIDDHRERVVRLAESAESPVYDANAVGALPEPVQRYFEFAFPEPPQSVSYVELTMEGDFRRPQTESFAWTTAEQTIAVGTPALVFSATMPIIPGVWARAYDAFGEGEMEMKAKILSTLTVMDEQETPELNLTSLQRWLLESPLYPVALLPGGPVRWDPIDDRHARAIVSADGLEASLVATFRSDGSLESFDAEEDGDLTTPYHGSGEHALRDDYRLVSGVMIPHSFTIARAADGQSYPFFVGQITSITYE